MRHLSALFAICLCFGCSEYELSAGVAVPEESKDLPIARCSVSPNPVAPPFETAAWDGSESEDPTGGTIEKYDWRLIRKPTGSAVTMPGGGMTRSGFMPDLAGEYVGQLVVINDAGLESEPCEAVLEAIPAQSLWVEMFWQHPGDDMDLHLIRANGQAETNSDCYYANCTPDWHEVDWGVSGDEEDDPFLDLDDIPGTGPENINIERPEDVSYTVGVHDYPGTVRQAANDVTVRIYLSGELVWEDERTINGENTYNGFARINWATGNITDL